jgi:uncharacterized membrane protein YgcG
MVPFDTEALQSITARLLEVYRGLYYLFITEDAITDCLHSLEAAVTHLMVAGMRHIGVTVHQQPQQQQQSKQQHQQQSLPDSLAWLAHSIAESTLVASVVPTARMNEDNFAELARVLHNKGPHVVVWSDLRLLLVTYSNTWLVNGQLPIGSGIAGSSSSDSVTVPAAESARGASSSSSGTSTSTSTSTTSSSSSSRQQQQPAGAKGPSTPVTEGLRANLAQALTAWQEVQGQWDRIPTSHKQLLQLLGVSPQAPVWVAAIMPRTQAAAAFEVGLDYGGLDPAAMAKYEPQQCVESLFPNYCWEWNPYNIAQISIKWGSTDPAALALQERVEQWIHTPLPELLQMVLLYGVLHDMPIDGIINRQSTDVMYDVLQFTQHLVKARLTAGAPTQQQSARPAACSSGWVPVLSPAFQEELLQLTLQLMQRAQQKDAAASSSPPRPSSPDPQYLDAVDHAARYYKPVHAGIKMLLRLPLGVQMGSPEQAAGLIAAQPQAPAAEMFAAAAEPRRTTGTLMAGAVFGVFEQHLRGHRKHPDSDYVYDSALDISKDVGYLSDGHDSPMHPNLLLRLAQGGSAEQQVGFSNLLVTLVKVLGSVESQGETLLYASRGLLSQAALRDVSRVRVAQAAVTMLSFMEDSSKAHAAGTTISGAASSSGGSSGGSGGSSSSSSSGKAIHSGRCSEASPAMWLLLLGRCCLTWADRLADRHRERKEGSYPWLDIIQQVTATLGEGSSTSAGLTAAGYDMGAVLQGFEAITASCPAVSEAAESENAAGDVEQHIRALRNAGCWQGVQCVCCATLLQQPWVQQPGRTIKVFPCVRHKLHLCRLSCCAVLWQRLSEGTLAAAQSYMQDAARRECTARLTCCRWRRTLLPQVRPPGGSLSVAARVLGMGIGADVLLSCTSVGPPTVMFLWYRRA